MVIRKPAVDYRKFRLNKLNTDEFRHLRLLLYWPVYGLLFLFVEQFYQVEEYYPVYCRLDDLIPFQELFLIPYMFWFIYLAGMLVYSLLYDIDTFKRYMKFIIITYTITIIIYLIFPTCQNLRPEVFVRDNFLTRFMAGFYQFDTNTNVCPSIHVLGSIAVMLAGWYAPGFQHWGWKLAFGISAFLICISTVFLKQHSILDVIAAVLLCIVGWWFSFRRKRTVSE